MLGARRAASLLVGLCVWLSTDASLAGPRVTEVLQRELSVTERMAALEAAIASAEQGRESLRYAAGVMDHESRDTLRRLQAYRKAAVARDRYAQRRGRALYKMARGGMLRIVFDQRDGAAAGERITRGRVIRQMIRQDLTELRVHRRAEERATAELVAATRERQALGALHMTDAMQQAALDLSLAQLTPELAEAHKARQRLLRQHAPTRRADKKLMHQIGRARRSLRGHGLSLLEPRALHRPVGGAVVGSFGTYKDRVMKVPMSRNGVELRARAKETVKAAADGEVAFVGELPGYEQVVVLDHGGGVLSLTGRLLGPRVKVGEEVAAGAPLGLVAPKRTDDGLGPTVYLELRHGERPVDPAPYLR